MYTIESTGQTEKSYFKAIEIATELNSNVIEESTGIVRWQPLPEVSKKKMREYRGAVNARKAYEKMINKEI
jgi:hypothetical protein